MAECLLIDDSRLARRICGALLQAAGHTVTEAAHGADGLEIAQKQQFDVILVDQFMPVMEGLAFISAYHERAMGHIVPIILCTSDATPALLHAARALGAAGYLNKPYTAGALRRQLDDLQLKPN